MKIAVSTVIDRPLAGVWRWYAIEHVRNHPRWDPDMELEQISEGPIGLGTRIRRRNRHFGEPIEGEMEIVEWEPPGGSHDFASSMASSMASHHPTSVANCHRRGHPT